MVIHVPLRYVPKGLSRKDKKKQVHELLKSIQMYKKGKYYTRKKVGYPVVKSKHLANVRRIYGQDVSLDMKIGCTKSTLEKIVRKGEGAYYSSGSRPIRHLSRGGWPDWLAPSLVGRRRRSTTPF